jgi:outer membrane protein OmpA-like peptidoglycan-associated protein
MKLDRLQLEQTKSESIPCRTHKVSNAAAPVSHWPVYDSGSPVLRLGHAFRPLQTLLLPGLQTKLTVSEPGDQYEQEADRVAEQVMRMPDTTVRLQRKCGCGGACEQCATRPPLVQRHANLVNATSSAGAPSIVDDVLRSSGRPLEASTRAFMEARFGHDFGSVRIHSDERATESAKGVNAFAYTVGPNIVFGAGQYAPQTSAGQRLLAHELTHVIQQAPAVSSSLGSTAARQNSHPLGTHPQGPRNVQVPTTRVERAVAPMIQRDPIPSDFGTGNIRLREDGQVEFLYGTPNAPVTGPLGAGFRCQHGRCQFVFGQDPSQLDHRTYTVQEAVDLLRGFGGSGAGPSPGRPPFPTPTPRGPGGPGPLMPGQPSSGICLRWDVMGRCTYTIPLPPGGGAGTTPTPGPTRLSPPALPPRSLGLDLRLTLEQSRTIDHFVRDSSAIPDGNDELLNQLATTINLAPNREVIIEGHTDSSATEEHNQQLSERRANAVRDALIARGVPASRLRVQGFGERRLRFADERNDEEKALNRRVEVRYRTTGPEPPASGFLAPPSLRLGG